MNWILDTTIKTKEIVNIDYIIITFTEMKNDHNLEVKDLCSEAKCSHVFSLKPLKTGLYYHDETLTMLPTILQVFY